MPDRDKPRPEVRQLLLEVIDSFEKLEVLVHLHRTPTGTPTTTALADALGIPGHVVADALTELLRDGLVYSSVEDGGGWRLDPKAQRAPVVDALVELYEADRIGVTTLMSELALERMRAQVAHAFADAFVIRGKKKKGEPDA